MKRIVFILLTSIIVTSVSAQVRLHTVPWYDWSSHTAFMLSPSPVVVGYGVLSDSLSKVHPDTTFYEYGGAYYPITSWADYYFWYVNKYWYQFYEPDLYEFYYFANDDYGMAQYICGANFRGTMYPSRIALTFPGYDIYLNHLSKRNVRQYIKNNNWNTDAYIAANGKYIDRLNKRNRTEVATNTNGREQRTTAINPEYTNSRNVNREEIMNSRTYTNDNSRGNNRDNVKSYQSSRTVSSGNSSRSGYSTNSTSTSNSSVTNSSINRSSTSSYSGSRASSGVSTSGRSSTGSTSSGVRSSSGSTQRSK